MKLHELPRSAFPMLTTFRILNDALSNAAQSAPGCTADFSHNKWMAIEVALVELPASYFVFMAYDFYFHDTAEAQELEQRLWAEPAFRAWAKTWE